MGEANVGGQMMLLLAIIILGVVYKVILGTLDILIERKRRNVNVQEPKEPPLPPMSYPDHWKW